MNKKKIIVSAVIVGVAVAAVLTVLIIFSGRKAVYRLVPEGACASMKVDVPTLVTKSFSGDKNSRSMDFLDGIFHEIDSRELRNAIVDLVEEPMSSGVSLTRPWVISMVPDYYEEVADIYLVIPLRKSRNFIEYADVLYRAAKDRYSDDDYYYEFSSKNMKPYKARIDDMEFYYLGLDEGFSIAVDKKYAVVYYSELDQEGYDVERLMENLFEGQEIDLSGFQEFKNSTNDVDLWVHFENMSRYLLQEIGGVSRDAENMLKEYAADLSLNAGLDIKKGKTTLNYSFNSGPELQEMLDGFISPASDVNYEMLPSNAVVAANIGLNTKAMSKYWAKLDEKSRALADIVDEIEYEYDLDEDLVKSFPSTISMVLASTGIDSVSSFCISMDCGKDVFEFIVELADDLMYIEKVASSAYSFNDVYLVYKDDTVLMMDDELWSQFKSVGFKKNFNESVLSTKIKRGGLAFDIVTLPGTAYSDMGISLTRRHLYEFVESIVYSYNGGLMKGELVLEMGDKERNIIQKIIQTL